MGRQSGARLLGPVDNLVWPPNCPGCNAIAMSKQRVRTDCIQRCNADKKRPTPNRRKPLPYNIVRETGLEPARVSPLDPKSSASANSATLANGLSCCYLPCFCLHFRSFYWACMAFGCPMLSAIYPRFWLPFSTWTHCTEATRRLQRSHHSPL